MRFRRLFTIIHRRLDYFLKLLTLSLVGIFYPRPVPIRSAQRWSCCVERDAEVRKVCRPSMSSGISCPRWLTGQTTAEGADGTSECPGVSTHERGDAGAISQPWDIQQAEKSIRVRNAGERLLPRPRFGSNDLARWVGPPLVCRYLSTVCGLLAWLAGGSLKRPFAKCSARSFGENGRREDGEPWRQRHPGR